ncbi:hypothetical protein ATN83_3497 [Raoultella ornithinolytica]|nr:hypothetical protein ATN83_3497 [Raoultella ornithinolytica]KDV95684.1 putative membrane protein [Raoultella ornithinolytica 2-156-04_S1_C1]KDX15201.1 putative membrane protein [Raoultella ornithinolytica 2-156-04_S1_C2]
MIINRAIYFGNNSSAKVVIFIIFVLHFCAITNGARIKITLP